MYQLANDQKASTSQQELHVRSEADPDDRRIVEVLRPDDGDFHTTLFKDLKEGDVFSLFDPKTNQPIFDKYGNLTHVADTDAYLSRHKTLGIVTWHIQIKDMPPPTGKETEDAIH